MKKCLCLIICICSSVLLLTGCVTLSNPQPPAWEWDNVDSIIIIKDRETQYSWHLEETKSIQTIRNLFQGMEFGAERSGGTAGSFLRIQLYGNGVSIGEIIMSSPNEIQYVRDDMVKTRLIVSGGWSAEEWSHFLEKCY